MKSSLAKSLPARCSAKELLLHINVEMDSITDSRIPSRPTKQQLLAARDKLVPDVIAPKLTVLFSGINPGLYSAATGHHFARPGNRFWPALFAGGFTPRLLSPWEEDDLLR